MPVTLPSNGRTFGFTKRNFSSLRLIFLMIKETGEKGMGGRDREKDTIYADRRRRLP